MKRAASGWSGLLALVLGLGMGSAAAQPAGPPVQTAEPVVVTATRVEEPLEQIGASVTIIPEELIEVQRYHSVGEALRAVPGVDVQRAGSPGKLTTVRIRGAGPGQTQVLIDGVRVKSLTSGDFDFADLPVDGIERIEVLRGPQSTIYGADAIGGVVNIITKRGRGTPSGFVEFEAGNYDTFHERAGAAGSVGDVRFSLGVSRLDFGGQFPNDEYELTNVNARVAYALPQQGELALVGRYTDTHRGIPFQTVFPDFDDNREQDDRLTLLSLEWRQPWTSWYEQLLRLSLFRTELTFQDPDSLFDPRSEIDNERREVEWLHRFDPAEVAGVTVGLEYRKEEGASDDAFSETTEAWAAFLQGELRFFERLFLTAGIRYDDSSAFDDETTGRVAVSYLVKATDTRWKASWGQGFRAPTFNDLFFPGFGPCPPFGNPDLRPEQSESWDAGVEQHLWKRRLRLGVTYFRNDFEELIQAALVDPENACFQAQNVGRARTQGVEVEGSIAPVDGLLVSVAYTYTDTEDRTTGEPLRRFPRDQWAVTAQYEALRGLTLTGELIVVSSQLEAVGQPRNDGYTVLDVGASYRLPWRWGPLAALTLHAKVRNLLDEDYAEVQGFPAPGTLVVAGLRATF